MRQTFQVIDPSEEGHCSFCCESPEVVDGVTLLGYLVCPRCRLWSQRWYINNKELTESPIRASESEAVRNIQAEKISKGFGKPNGTLIVGVAETCGIPDYPLFQRCVDIDTAAVRFRLALGYQPVTGPRVLGVSERLWGKEVVRIGEDEEVTFRPGTAGVWTPAERGV